MAGHKVSMRFRHNISLADWTGTGERHRKMLKKKQKWEGRKTDFSRRTQPQPRLIRNLPSPT